jgi:hypothetical protein
MKPPRKGSDASDEGKKGKPKRKPSFIGRPRAPTTEDAEHAAATLFYGGLVAKERLSSAARAAKTAAATRLGLAGKKKAPASAKAASPKAAAAPSPRARSARKVDIFEEGSALQAQLARSNEVDKVIDNVEEMIANFDEIFQPGASARTKVVENWTEKSTKGHLIPDIFESDVNLSSRDFRNKYLKLLTEKEKLILREFLEKAGGGKGGIKFFVVSLINLRYSLGQDKPAAQAGERETDYYGEPEQPYSAFGYPTLKELMEEPDFDPDALAVPAASDDKSRFSRAFRASMRFAEFGTGRVSMRTRDRHSREVDELFGKPGAPRDTEQTYDWDEEEAEEPHSRASTPRPPPPPVPDSPRSQRSEKSAKSEGTPRSRPRSGKSGGKGGRGRGSSFTSV